MEQIIRLSSSTNRGTLFRLFSWLCLNATRQFFIKLFVNLSGRCSTLRLGGLKKKIERPTYLYDIQVEIKPPLIW